MTRLIMVLSMALAWSPIFAQEPVAISENAETDPAVAAEDSLSTPESAEPDKVAAVAAPVFVVILPERIDHDWYWILYSDTSQQIVQGAIEKSLIREGMTVIDLQTATMPSYNNDLMKLQSVSYAVQAGKQLKADYVISGQATAVKASEGSAYGVNVVRTQAEITAKIIRVSDGKILDVEDASLLEGGQSAQAAGQTALKKAGAQIASKLVRFARTLPAPESPAQ